ncbi:MAG: DUF4252 domain-containing protein [Alloprevotella sp.]|nr:DUF4252 domain-containing protein [Alloprevotella sp.]
MKRALFSLAFILCTVLSLSAQTEKDFSSRFLEQEGVSAEVNCQTIGPDMIAQLASSYATQLSNEEVAQLKNIKSMRVVRSISTTKVDELFHDALSLLQQDKGRYYEILSYGEKKLFGRKKNKTIVELILLVREDGFFNLVNLTGTYDEQTLKQLISKTQ